MLAALAALLCACGGGGVGPAPPVEQALNLGLVRADAPSTLTAEIANPFDGEAQVEAVEAPAGPFAFAPGALPGVVAAGAGFSLHLLFTPPGPGVHADVLRIRFRRAAGRGEQEFIVSVSARVEATSVALVTTALDFGRVLIGQAKTLGVTVRNPNQLTPVEVTALSGLPGDFRADLAPPATVAPGKTLAFAVTYEPAALADHAFQLAVHHSEATFPLLVEIAATTDTWIPEVITDFGDVPVANGETEWLDVDLPPHAVSLGLEAVGPSGAVIGLLGFEGPGGRVYENAQATGAYLWTPGDEGVFTAGVPNSDRQAVGLVDGGGTYRFRLFLMQGSAATLEVRAIVHNRPAGINDAGVLDLNVFLAPGLGITDPLGETRLQQVLDRTDEIYAQQGLRLGAISYFQLADAAYDEVDIAEFPALLEESAAAPEVRLNLFFVQATLSGGVLGVAARVAGPARNGTRASGVMVDYDFGSVATAGHVTAHELGHYLGLFHTAESGGGHDIIDDTVECPASGTSAACPTEGNGYLMHWRVLSADPPVITAGQGLVMLGHPLVQPPAPRAALAQHRGPAAAGAPEILPEGWCGTPIAGAK